MNATDKSRAIDKIKKLLALATDKSANEHEAATAMRQARFLMDQHNIDESAIGDAPGSDYAFTTYDTIWCLSPGRAISPFLSAFANLLSSVFNVVCVISAKRHNKRDGTFVEMRAAIKFYGSKVDAQLAEYSAAVVWRALSKDRDVYAAAEGLRGTSMAHQRQVLLGFSVSWLTVARDKLAAVFKDEDKLNKAKDYQMSVLKTSSIATKSARFDSHACDQGAEAGSKFNISRPVSGAPQKALSHG